MTDYAKLARTHFDHGASFDELRRWYPVVIESKTGRFAYLAEIDKIEETYIEKVEKLRAEYEKVENVDPAQPTYGELCRFLDNLSTGMLRLLMNAEIKWLSSLARNRYNTRRG